jgi:Ca2+-binding EF-hand superfamily protein
MGNKAGRATASKGATSAGGTAGGMATSAVNAQRAALIDKLASRTEFTTEDVSNLYDEFMNIAAETPSTPNCIQREQFLDVLNKHHVDWRSDLFVEYLFDAFDVDFSGALNFREFVRCLNLVSKGTAHDKLGLSFKIYDINKSGTISKWEMKLVLEQIFVDADKYFARGEAGGTVDKTGAVGLTKDGLRAKISEAVDSIFKSFDKDQSGKLTFMEYVQASMSLPELTDYLKGIDFENTDIVGLVEARKAGRQDTAKPRAAAGGLAKQDSTLASEFELAFEKYDIDGTGRIAKEEFQTVYSAMHTDDAAAGAGAGGEGQNVVDEIFERFDKDKKGLSLMEFINAAIKNPDIASKGMFAMYDKDGKKKMTA